MTPDNADKTYLRALYKASGYSDEDLQKPLIAIANSWTELNPGHSHLRETAEHVKRGVWEAGGMPALIEVTVNRKFPHSGSPAAGWWDVPIPTYLKDRRKEYDKARKEEAL